MSSTENLPAWKRLGLKLKYAKETPSDQPEHDAPIQYPDINKDHEKRKRSHDSKDKQQRKKAKHEQGRVSKLAVDQHEQPNDHDNEQPSATDRFISSVYGRQSTHGVHKTPQKIKFDDNESAHNGQATNGEDEHKLVRKKSVTFTPETKQEDGDSGQAFAKAWLAPRNGVAISEPLDSTPTKSPRESPDKIDSEPAQQTKAPKRQKVKKPKSKKGSSSVDQLAVVSYLQQFNEDRGNWKFNKGLQNSLFKHIWDVQRIPPSIDIVQYSQGLQGGARKRLQESASEIFDAFIQKHMDQIRQATTTSEVAMSRQALWLKAEQEQETLLQQTNDEIEKSELRTEVQKADRARLLLKEVFPEHFDSEPLTTAHASATHADRGLADQKDTKEDSTAPVSKRKARKSRTAMLSDSDSSSDSSSESDSSESSSDSDSSSDSESD